MSIGLTGKDDGTTPPTGANGVGVHGTSSAGAGVAGESGSSYGVHGTSLNGVGVFGESVLQTAPGVTATVVGVLGLCRVGTAVRCDRLLNTGLTIPLSTNYASGFLAGDDPVFGLRAGVYGESDQQGVMGIGGIHGSTGVYGNTKTGDGFGVRGETTTGTAIWGRSLGSGLAGSFIGNVQVIGRFVGNVEFAGDVLDWPPLSGPGGMLV
jgi:hypothetical protein